MSLQVYYPVDAPLYPRKAGEDAWQMLLARLDPSITLITGSELPTPAEYQVLIAGRPTKAQLEASPNLHTLLIPWAGLPEVTRETMRAYPQIAIHNLHHNAIPTAETALMLLLTAAKHILPIDRKFRQHDWRPRYAPNPAVMLNRKTVLILGYGSIGQHVGQVCRAMGMRVLSVRRSGDALANDPAQAEIHAPGALPELLPQANVLMVTIPLTDETDGMIGETELALLPDQAIVVNVGRAAVIDQGALYQTLESGKLHSAGLDVWYNYPTDEASRANTPPADYPFQTLENVVMSPHRGGGSREVEILRLEKMSEFLNAVALGEDIPNRIDLEKGY